ncbi:hypothetical protein A3731_23150 [Roseovarius sp. HI0049]|nr:hypothetical protein A3731_23150 [Roseovarius sp. HI0049]
MQYDSQGRLGHLAAIKRAKLAAAREADDYAQELRDRLRREEQRRAQLADEAVFRPADVAKQIAAVDEKIAAIRTEKANHEKERERLAAELQAAGGAYGAALRFAKEKGLPVPYDADEGSHQQNSEVA